MRQIKGSKMCPKSQREALARFVHRYTGDHVPAWVTANDPLQFKDDKDWLEHTLFWVNADGSLGDNKDCESSPTWPNRVTRYGYSLFSQRRD